MKKHLKYIDGSSDKFWQIEVLEATYTVTYGRNGTNGVSQARTYADSAECLKMAEKLLNEKIKKGYSENGDVVPGGQAAAVQTRPKDTDRILKEYDEIILSRDITRLLPFIKENYKGNLEALKKQIKKNKKYWMTFIDFKDEPEFRRNGNSWGMRGDEAQIWIITSSAVALFSKTEILPWDEVFDLLAKAMDAPILEILQWAKPDWICEYLLIHTRKNEWRRFSYPTLRLLEKESLVVHHPELYALCMGSFNEYRSKMKTRDYISNILNDPLAYGRDVPELFNYETELHLHHYKENDHEPHNAFHTWESIYTSLLQEGKMNKNLFIGQAILIQTKDWKSNLRSFFRKRLAALAPMPGELIPWQEDIFSCLHSPLPPITNFALELVKNIYEHQKFAIASFLDWLEPVMMSVDNKTAVKNSLPLLEKINKLHPKFNKKISSLLADVYVIPDMNLQERVTKILLKIASAKDKDLREKLSGYMPLMQGNIRSLLSPFLTEGTPADTINEAYQFEPVAEKVLTRPVELPKNWNDILYLFGKFINSDEVADSEILVNAFIMQTHLFPPDYTAQLQPYKIQIEKKYSSNVCKAYVSAFLKMKIANYAVPCRVTLHKGHKIKTLLLGNELLEAVNTRTASPLKSPLLSFPTHLPHWITPKALMERLVARQQQQEQINKLDLSIAISRMPAEEIQEAIPLLDQLTGELKTLMAFCLGTTKKISVQPETLLNKLFTKIRRSEPDDLNGVWAVAARTRYPDAEFPEFAQTQFKELDFAVSPFQLKPGIQERWHESINYQTREKERSASWYELNFDLSAYKAAPSPYLFAQDLYGSKKGWEYLLSEGDVYYWNSLMPQQNDPLAYFLLRGQLATVSIGGMELKAFLNIVNAPGFRFSEITVLAFACTFFQDKKEIRLMAAEVLINRIEKKGIDLDKLAEKMAYLASSKYGPFSRLVESITMMKDVSDLHNSALLQFTESFFAGLDVGEKLPVNFKRLVEHYVDLLYRTKQHPSAEAIRFFEKYKDSASLKSLATQILTTKT